jgi:carboxyl-terminal processing protease
MVKTIVLWTALCVAAAPVQAQTTPLVATFDSAWSIVQRTHFDTTFNGLDWPRVRDELRPRAAAARSDAELRALLLEMLQRLKQSHFSIIPKALAEAPERAGGAGDLGMDVRWVENALVVVRVDPGGPAAAVGIKPGWTLERVANYTVDSMVARARREPIARQHESIVPRIALGRLSGPEGSSVELELRDGNNRRTVVRPVRRPEPGAPVKFGNLPAFYTRFATQQLKHEGIDVGVIAFNVWMVPVVARIDTAMDRHRGAHGIIIDLRGNPGGVAAMSMGVAGHLVDTALALGTMKGRTSRLEFRINPRRVSTSGERVTPFAGPVALLTDELSGSTSEVFAGGLQTLGRVRVFGARSMGAVLPAAMDRLPNGDVLYHAIADFTTPNGTVLEGRGVIPDEPIELKRAELLAGRDPVLEAALRWIAAQARAQRRTTSTEIRP